MMRICGVFTLLVVFSCLLPCIQSKQCVRFQDSPMKACSAAGYNYTYALPDDLSDRTVNGIKKRLVSWTKEAENCSVVQMAESIICMMYAPKCQDASKDPVLPCRRVCSELMKRCYNVISPWIMDSLHARCFALANDTAASGKCYEPKNFEKYYNPNTKGPLERGCQKLVNFPFCKDMGYNYTIITAASQARAYRFLYRKSITDPDPETPNPGSALSKLMSRMRSAPKCAISLKKLFCSEAVPPCFPDEGPAYYTVCKPVCKSIGQNCPQVLTGLGQYYYGECDRMAPGISSHGYCKHTKLPPITEWPDYSRFRRKPTTSPPPSKGMSTTVIVIIAVVVPVVIVLVIIAVVFVVKTRKNDNMFSFQRQA